MLAVTVDWNLVSKYQGIVTPWTMVLMVVVIASSAWLIFQFKAWFRDSDGRTDDNLEMLTQFRDLHLQGELTEDEYRLIKGRLARNATAGSLAGPIALESAKDATGAVRRRGGTENTGETGLNDADRHESRTSDESPNLKSAAETESETNVSGMNPDL